MRYEMVITMREGENFMRTKMMIVKADDDEEHSSSCSLTRMSGSFTFSVRVEGYMILGRDF